MEGDLQQRRVEIDETYLKEWVKWGFRELESFLAHHAQFEAWCNQHHRPAA